MTGKPAAEHFNSKDHSHRIFFGFVIEQTHREEAKFRWAEESYWIQTLQSLALEGFNLDLYDRTLEERWPLQHSFLI